MIDHAVPGQIKRPVGPSNGKTEEEEEEEEKKQGKSENGWMECGQHSALRSEMAC